MGFRYIRVPIAQLHVVLPQLPTSVRIVGTVACAVAELPQCAFLLEGQWADEPEGTPIRECKMTINDRFKHRRIVELEDVSPVIGSGARPIIVPGGVA